MVEFKTFPLTVNGNFLDAAGSLALRKDVVEQLEKIGPEVLSFSFGFVADENGRHLTQVALVYTPTIRGITEK